MEVFRICRDIYADRIWPSGSANRWNLRGQNVIYTGCSRSLSTLELVVHRSSIVPTLNYRVMVISIADNDNLISQIHVKELPENWRKLSAYSTLQQIGSTWYKEQRSLILKVPSAVIPLENNFVINTEHTDYEMNVMFVRTEDYFWDSRLL